MKLLDKQLLLAVFLTMIGCTSKVDQQLLTCADFESSQITIDTAMKRLRLTSEHTKVLSEIEIVDEYCDVLDWRFCWRFLVQTVVAHYPISSVWNAKHLFRFKVSAIDSAALDDADLWVRHWCGDYVFADQDDDGNHCHDQHLCVL